MSLVAQCLRGSGLVPRSKIRFRLKARENKVLGPLQADNARSEGLNGKPSADKYAPPVRGMMWCPIVAPRNSPKAPRSSQAATQPAASEPGPSTPLPAKRTKRTKAEPEAAANAKPAPQPGRWLDRDCNAALNMQRIGESRWRPLELCYWPEQGALPAKGKEYPGLGYKRLRDKPPKAQQQQAPPI
ncbi:hypothetical protein QJQ45_027515 [Haematococcus lacustris]|nr:hypothetical protein QJQ45_027515 [Haematococcus lacustris]